MRFQFRTAKSTYTQQLLTWKTGLETEDLLDTGHSDLGVKEMHLECIIRICIMEMQEILCTGRID